MSATTLLRRRSAGDSPAEVPAALEGPGAPWGPAVHAAWATYTAAVEKASGLRTRATEAAQAADALDAGRLDAITAAAGSDDVDTALRAARAAHSEAAAALEAARVDALTLEEVASRAEAAVDHTRSAVLTAQADDLEARCRGAIDTWHTHDMRTRALLDQLAAHDGVYAPAVDVPDVAGAGHGVQAMTRGESLRADAQRLSLLAWVTRLVALGHPRPEFDGVLQIPAGALPATVWGPHALVDADHSTTSPAVDVARVPVV